jgi:ATP-binding cassette subfamily B (MDR/TAP) protein 1
MLAVGCSQLLLFWVSMYLFMISSEELTNRLRVVYVSSLLAKDPSYFADHGPGELSSRIGTDIEAVRVGLGEKMAYVGQSLGIMVASTVLGFVRAASIAGVLFPIIPLVLGLFTLLGIASEKISSPASSLDGRVATFMEQLLTAPRIVHAFDATQTLLRKLDKAFLTPLSKWNRRRAMIRAVELSAVYVILLWLYGAFFAWGAHQISGGSTTVGPAITAFWSFVNVFFSLANLVPHLGSIMQAFSSLKALRHTIEEVPAIDARDQSGIRIADDPQRAPCFRFEDVTYAYPSRPRTAALDRINLEIEANTVTAFVGASGSGKSTMMALLLREFDPKPQVPNQGKQQDTPKQEDLDVEKKADLVCNGGRVLYAGHDLRDLNVESYRSEIGIISQHLQLFTGSVLDNVSAGLSQVQSEKITGEALRVRAKAALVKAQAWNFVSELPSGMDTQLKGGHSNMLSGGQRQRLALARGEYMNGFRLVYTPAAHQGSS